MVALCQAVFAYWLYLELKLEGLGWICNGQCILCKVEPRSHSPFSAWFWAGVEHGDILPGIWRQMWSYSNHVLFAPGRTQWLKWCPSDVRFHPVIGFNITSDGTNQNGANQWDAVRMLCHHGAHDRDTQPAWLQRNTGLSEIEQLSKNNWSIFFKSIKVIKIKGKTKECSEWGKLEAGPPKTIYEPRPGYFGHKELEWESQLCQTSRL